jgi:hypothetical protein
MIHSNISEGFEQDVLAEIQQFEGLGKVWFEWIQIALDVEHPDETPKEEPPQEIN